MILLTIDPPKIWAWKAHAGYGRHSFNPMQKERDFVQYQIKKQYHDDILSRAVRISYDFFFTTPKSVSKKKREMMIAGEIKHTVRGDCTNYCKFWEDCLKGIVIVDDSLAYRNEVEKHYGESNRVIIKIYPYVKN